MINVPRRGAFVARKTKAEILEMITVWAALESMAARLATQNAKDTELAELRLMFSEFPARDDVKTHLDEYSEANINFHQSILRLSHCNLLNQMTENLFLHIRGIRRRTISERERASKSIVDHIHIIEALEARDTERAERLARQHTLDLAAHVNEHVDWLK